MPAWIVAMVVNFLVRQVKRWADTLDWNKVKADVAARLKPLLPDWSENAVLDVVNAALDVCAYVLSDAADLKAIADMLQAGDVAGALSKLAQMFEDAIHKPHAAHVIDFAAKAQSLADACRECAKAA